MGFAPETQSLVSQIHATGLRKRNLVTGRNLRYGRYSELRIINTLYNILGDTDAMVSSHIPLITNS
jgi:hypothetical protein